MANENKAWGRLSSDRGFTLIELLMAFLIIAALTAMGMMHMGDVRRRSGDAVAISEGRSLINAVSSVVLNQENVDLTHAPADGRTIETRTLHHTVAQVLAQEGVALMGQDFSRPPLTAALAGHDTVAVVRVQETLDILEELIPFETRWIPAAFPAFRHAATTASHPARTRSSSIAPGTP